MLSCSRFSWNRPIFILSSVSSLAIELTIASTDWLTFSTVLMEVWSKDRAFWIFSPSALRMWDRAVCWRATDSNRSVTAWARGRTAGVVVVDEVVEDVVVVVVVEEVVVDEVVEVVEDVVEEVVDDVVEDVVEEVVEEVVISWHTVGSGSSPVNSSLWLSALPVKESKMMLPLIWLKVVVAAAKGASTEP